MKRLLRDSLFTSLFLGVCIFCCWYGFQWGHNEATRSYPVVMEQHELCYDTDKYEAWVAHKDGFMRCFMEYKQYPHRVRASHID